MPRLASPAKAFREVFISSTKVDLEEYRLAVRNALADEGIIGFLFDYDAQPAIPVVDYCINRIHRTSDAYLGIYGYRYGWIPQLCSKSITHLEYETACARWVPSERHRLFLFRPEPGSRADNELKSCSDRSLARDFPDDGSCSDWEAKRQECRKKQETFLRIIDTPGVIVNRFKDRDDLAERAPLAVRNGEGLIDQRAASERGRPGPIFDPAGFGAVGRDEQLECLLEMFRTLLATDTAPALSVVVHGQNDMGHRWFTDCLLQWPPWQAARDHSRLIPPGDRTETTWLRNTMATELAPGSAALVSDFATLARVIRDRCLDDHTVVVLDHVERLRDGLAGFHDAFWVPLHRALHQTWSQRPAPYRLVLVVVLRSPLPPSLPSFIWSGTGDEVDINYERLLFLPQLGKFKKADVRHYMRTSLSLWDIDKTTIDRLVGDCIPVNVYGRLINSNLIPETGR